MAPFGFGNPPPLLAILDAEIAATDPSSSKKNTLRVHFRQNGRNLLSKAWNFARSGHRNSQRARAWTPLSRWKKSSYFGKAAAGGDGRPP